jgi:phosphohistidine phosphatase
MKTLMLLRHGKSSWSDPDLDDDERPLTGRGKRAAKQMGELLAEKKLVPDLILSSTAKRARKTASLAAEASGYGKEVKELDELYLASSKKIVAQIRAHTPEKVGRVLVVGHNPGLEELVDRLAGSAEEFPTAALAIFEVSIDNWRDLELGVRCKLTGLFRPRQL